MNRYGRTLLVLAIAAAAVTAGTGTALAQGTRTACAASFHVLHDDRIGSLRLPKGAYRLRADGISCLRASRLFTEFLQDWDGRLPRPWRYGADGVGEGTFSRGGDGPSFQAQRTGDATPGAPGHPTDGGGIHGELACPGVFEVLHDNRIGALRIPRGAYVISRLGVRLACATAVRLFRRFLEHPDGRLPGGWVVLPAQAEFVKSTTHFGFAIEPADVN